MGKYKMDMSKESERLTMQLENGWYPFEVVDMVEDKSKSGNMMFKITLALAKNPSEGCIVYTIAEEGKRWFLKQLLGACDCPASADGVYEFDIDEIIGKIVSGYVDNVIETWINRQGEEQSKTKSKVVAFKRYNSNEAI